MKSLEDRRWFVLSTLSCAAAVMGTLWYAAGMPTTPTSFPFLMFATLGIWSALDRLLALLLIRIRPSLGAIR